MVRCYASKSGWGATDGINPTEGIWSGHYKAYHMNYLFNTSEWKLDPSILKPFSAIDIFASHLNYQVPTYVPWNPDKNTYATDAFSISWANLKFYAFLPFNLIGAFILKIRKEMAAGIMILSWWVTQLWFLMMVPLLQDFSVVLPLKVWALPSNKGLQHSVYPKMKLLAVHFLGKPSDMQNFHQKLLSYLEIMVTINKFQI